MKLLNLITLFLVPILLFTNSLMANEIIELQTNVTPSSLLVSEGMRVSLQSAIKKFVTDNKKYLRITTKDGFIELLQIQLQGRKRMEVQSFLNGYTIEEQ